MKENESRDVGPERDGRGGGLRKAAAVALECFPRASADVDYCDPDVQRTSREPQRGYHMGAQRLARMSLGDALEAFNERDVMFAQLGEPTLRKALLYRLLTAIERGELVERSTEESVNIGPATVSISPGTAADDIVKAFYGRPRAVAKSEPREPDDIKRQVAPSPTSSSGPVCLVKHLADGSARMRFAKVAGLSGQVVLVEYLDEVLHCFARDDGRCVETTNGAMTDWSIHPDDLQRFKAVTK